MNEGRLYNVLPWAISADKKLLGATLVKHLKSINFHGGGLSVKDTE